MAPNTMRIEKQPRYLILRSDGSVMSTAETLKAAKNLRSMFGAAPRGTKVKKAAVVKYTKKGVPYKKPGRKVYPAMQPVMVGS